jgi:hypothetical protein
MITVGWNTIEFHGFSVIPKGTEFKASDDTREISEQIRKRRQAQRTGGTSIIHAENERSHTARTSLDFLETNGVKKSFASTRLITVGSFLHIFWDVKRVLHGCGFGTPDELLSAIKENLNGVEKSFLR